MTADLAAKARLLRELHVPGRPLVLPNAWDAASAKAVVAAGFAAVATGSAAVAESLGFEDGEAAPVDEMFAAIGRIARAVDVPVTADIEAGYGLEPADLVDRLLAAGAVGCNLEDTDHAARARATLTTRPRAGGDPADPAEPGDPRDGAAPRDPRDPAATAGLVDAERHADRIAAIVVAGRAAGVPIVVNARVDVFILEVGEPATRLAEATRRARRYLEAGAACVYPIWVADEPTISAFVEACPGPVNVYARPEAPPVERLAALGVARVSFGPWIHRLAMREARRVLDRIGAGLPPFEGPAEAAGG